MIKYKCRRNKKVTIYVKKELIKLKGTRLLQTKQGIRIIPK